MGRIVMGCVREVSLAQVSCILMYVYVAPPHQWVRGRWPWGYGSVLSIITVAGSESLCIMVGLIIHLRTVGSSNDCTNT